MGWTNMAESNFAASSLVTAHLNMAWDSHPLSMHPESQRKHKASLIDSRLISHHSTVLDACGCDQRLLILLESITFVPCLNDVFLTLLGQWGSSRRDIDVCFYKPIQSKVLMPRGYGKRPPLQTSTFFSLYMDTLTCLSIVCPYPSTSATALPSKQPRSP